MKATCESMDSKPSGYNYFELDDFELKSLELLGIDKNWLINMSLEDSHCTHQLTK